MNEKNKKLMKDAFEKEVESQLEVNENILDRQSKAQPRLVWKYLRLTAEAQKKLDEAEATYKVILAEVDERIRKHPDAYGVEKVTDASVKNALAKSKKLQQATTYIIEAKYELNLVSGALKAVETKGFSIHFLGGLLDSAYINPQLPHSRNKRK